MRLLVCSTSGRRTSAKSTKVTSGCDSALPSRIRHELNPVPHPSLSHLSAARFLMGRTTTTLTRHSRTASFTASYAAINSISKNNSLNCDHGSVEDGMDSAYDQINQSALTPDERDRTQQQNQGASTLNNDFQEAYKAISSSPWGARLGGFFGSVVKQVRNSRIVWPVDLTNARTGRECLQGGVTGVQSYQPGCNEELNRFALNNC